MVWHSLAMSIGAVHMLSMAGCNSGTSGLPDRFEPAKAAEVAMRMVDANQDGLLNTAELEKCPALQGALVRIDTDRDGVISSEEIANRIEAYKLQSKLVATSVLVVSGRLSVPNVSVILELEPFMGENLTPFSGTTDERGMMEVMAEGSDAPPGLLPPGFYRVRLSPAGDDAAEVVRGCEVADDVPSSRLLVFSLNSKTPPDRGLHRFNQPGRRSR